jgi:DNA-binding transcriptional regulator LsrR (DeoR family)
MMHRIPLEPLDAAAERHRIWNCFYLSKMDTADIARALGISEAEADRKLTKILETRRAVKIALRAGA